MKKLMIAAAAAAMIGGASAQIDDLVYDVSASLKTTKGAKAKSQNYTVNLGKSAAGILWWDKGEGIVQDGSEDRFGAIDGVEDKDGNLLDIITYTLDAAGNPVTAEFNDIFEKLSAEQKDIVAKAFQDADGNIIYNVKSAGKWCQTFKYTLTPPCYRVAATRSIKATVVVNDCCGAAWTLYTNAKFELVDKKYIQSAGSNEGDVSNVFLYRFGAQDVTKATKVEYLGSFGTLDETIANAPAFWFAGQGTWAKLGRGYDVDADGKIDYEKDAADKVVYTYGVSAISGNIVGTLVPTCEDCCRYEAIATAFQCGVNDYVEDDKLVSAAFGTWSMKINKKFSNLK